MGKKYLVVFVVTILVSLMIPSNMRAQAPGSEADVIKKAADLFEEADYPAAMPLYSQLLANHPKDPNYNYRFGVCMLYANADKEKALPFLEVASKDPKAEVEVWFYLGRAYHLNYRFDEAIRAYSKFKTIAGEKKAEKLQVNNQIAMCKTGKKLLKAVTDITVLEKKELPVGDFFRSYNLEGYSGQLLVKGDEFKTNLDRKKNETSIVFLSGEKNILYFSSYGDNEENGKDIYRVVRLPTGGWSKPYNVGYPINTEYDEDYPFLHPNGRVLYFSSKGHNSMGGYDIFRSELNEETGSWLKPKNMDFAINSSDDDILFVTDLAEKMAWFASARNSPQGFMTVYHVVIERKPVNMCIISGKFKPSGVDPTANSKITVRNEETNQPVGVYNSNAQTGVYLINLPNTGGMYTFTVEKSGIHTQTKTVFIPPQYELKPVRQEIFFTESNGDQLLNVVTYFDEDSASFAPDFLKDKANLEIGDGNSQHEVVDLGNPNQKDPNNEKDPIEGDSIDDPDGRNDPSNNVPSSQNKVTTEELIASAFENADETEKEASQLDQQKDRAFTYAQKLNEEAKAKQAEADKAKADAAGMPEGPDKIAAIEKAAVLQGEANALQVQTVGAFNLAEALDQDVTLKKAEAKLAVDYANSIQAASKSSDPKAMDALAQVELALQNQSDVRPQVEEFVKNLTEAADKKREKLQSSKSKSEDLRDEQKSNQELINSLQADAAKEKDPDLKAGYESQIEGIRETMAENELEIKKADAKVASLQNEVNELDNKVLAATNAMNEAKNPAVAPVAMNAEDRMALGENVVAYDQRVSDNSTRIEPVTQNPVTQNPNTQNPNTQNPNTQNPVTQNPNTQNPVTQDPNTQNPVTQNPNTQNPITQDPNTQNPVTQDPNTQNPVTQDPNTQNPVTQNLNTQNPVTQDPNTQNPVTQNPNTQNPVKQDPNTQNPVTQDPNSQTPIVSASDDIAELQSGVSEKLQVAEDETDPIQKEKLIGAAHVEAEKLLDQKIAEAQTLLNNESDPARKKSLQSNIGMLNEEKERQHQLAIDSNSRLQEAIATSAVNETPADPFVEYTSNLATADTISDPAAKERAKADVYSQWAAAVDEKVAEDKKLVSAAKSKTEKDSLKQVMAADQKKSTELKQLASEAKVNEQNAIAQQNSPSAKSEKAYENHVYVLDQNTNVAERETAKETLYTAWADSLENEANKLDAIASKERNEKKKTDLLAQANDLRSKAEDKRALATTSRENYQNSVATQNPVTQNPFTQNLVTQNPNAVVEEGISYADQQAKDALIERNSLQNDAKVLRAEQDSLIGLAETKGGNEKITLLADASEAQRQAWNKEADASAKQGEANKEQFDNNSALLTNYQAGAIGNSDPKVQAAELLNDEAVALLKRAGDKRAEAKLATRQYQRSEALKEAEELEQQALFKQQDGLARYQQAGVEPVEVVAQNPTTQNPVTQNQVTQNPVTQNPTTQSAESAIVNPATGTPYSKEQVEAVREAPAYVNYTALQDEASGYDEEVISLTREGDKYQKSADYNVAQAQDFSVKAADEIDPEKKRALVAQSNYHNAEAKKEMAKRDSVNELAKNATIEANAKHAEAELTLDGLDKKTSDDVKMIGDADVSARNGNPVTQNPVTQNPVTQNPVTQNPVTQNPVTQNPVTQNPVTQNPVTQNPVTQNPVIQNPVTQNPVTQNPVTQNPITQNPVTQNPVNQNPVNQNPVNQTPVDPGNTSRVATQLQPGEEFKVTAQPNAKEIPVDTPVPSGIVYKVQIGAFRNAIPLDLFKGIQPVTAESSGIGITRYTAGLFIEFANADAAKNEIRAMGYPDAFVVAFRDGKRISVAEARRGVTNPVVNNQTPNNQTPNNQTPNNQTPNNLTPNTFEASAVDVKTVQGLFYTVQVGVYSRPVSADRLFNLTGLFSERTANGYIRYASGKYDSANAAIAAKNSIVSIGIKDAFVTAYFEGQRISIDRAAILEREGVKPEGTNQSPNNQTPPNGNGDLQSINNQTPVVPTPIQPTQPQGANPVPNITNTKPNVPETGLFFSVQLGAYREVVPVAMANRFLVFASRGVSIYKDANTGLTVYQVGALNTYAEAAALKAEAVSSGITDAFIVARNDGKMIGVEEALKVRPQ